MSKIYSVHVARAGFARLGCPAVILWASLSQSTRTFEVTIFFDLDIDHDPDLDIDLDCDLDLEWEWKKHDWVASYFFFEIQR